MAAAGVAYDRPPVQLCLEDDLPLAFSPALEDEMLPSVDRIAESVRAAVGAPA